MKDEIYVSVDVEADGPIPGPNSMLSFAAAAFNKSGELLATFTANLDLLDGASGHPETMGWWSTQKEAWDATRINTKAPAQAMKEFVDWVYALPGKPCMVGYPVTYDFMFIYWYMMRFVGKSPFSHSGLDIKTAAMFMLKKNYRDSTKRNMPARWFSDAPHTHVSLDDAIEQGQLFINMLKEHMGSA